MTRALSTPPSNERHASARQRGAEASVRADADADVALALSGVGKRFPVHRSLWRTIRHPRSTEWVTSLTDVSFSVRRGELLGILGPNGAGKTTLFRCITGLVIPDGGTISVDGADVGASTRAARAKLGVVFANERALNWRLDARENLRLHAALCKIPRERTEARIDEVLEQVNLVDTGDRLLGTFSSGMKQRVSIARALMNDPPILLLDEPTRSLDPVSAEQFRSFLREEVVGRGKTVVLATHSAEEAFGICDRVVVMDRGRVLAVDVASRLADRYADDAYRAWVQPAGHAVVTSLGGRPADGVVADEGWEVVEFPAIASSRDAAQLLARLVGEGVAVSRFERTGLSLGDLLVRIVEDRRSLDAGRGSASTGVSP